MAAEPRVGLSFEDYQEVHNALAYAAGVLKETRKNSVTEGAAERCNDAVDLLNRRAFQQAAI